MPDTRTRQVVVVGGGPVGVGLALDLSLRGISSTVVERRTELSAIPKGQGLSQRTMETMAGWGVAERVRAARTVPADHPIGQVTVYGDLLGEFWHASPDRALLAPYYSQANERLPQYRTEAVLRRALSERPDTELLLGARAVAVQQDADGVRVRVQVGDGPGAQEHLLEADYVVGCDGGRSLVREQLDIPRAGTDWQELVALVVFRSRDLHEALGRFPERSTYRVMHPDLHGYWMFFGRVDADEEFFFHAPVPPGSTAADLDVEGLLRRAAGFDVAVQVDHVGFWDLRVQVATRYRSGRAFIAGDAAHTHPPYGGFGLNNGLEDAVNLSWKLAAVLDGWGGPALLDSYDEERRAVFHDVGEDIIGGWIRADAAFLAEWTPDRDRAEFARRFEVASGEFGRRLRGFEPHYEGSPVVLGPPGAVSGAHGEHLLTARVGHHLPPRPLSTGGLVTDALGAGPGLLALDADPAAVTAFASAAHRAGMPLAVVEDTRAGGREDYGSALVLVRPDRFVAWAGDTAPPDVDAVVARFTGHG